MSWQMALLLLFGFLAAFCLVWIVIVEANERNPVIRAKPWNDPRRDAYRNLDKDWK